MRPSHNGESAREPESLTDAWQPLGQALIAFHRGDHSATFMVRSTLWEDEVTPVADYYRPTDMPLPLLENHALDLCRGRVLDIGAGAGRHTLELQDRGHRVTAIDLSPEAVWVMQDRGVEDARCCDIYGFNEGTFDTILLMMHGIGVVGTISGLNRLLRHLPRLLKPGGQILCDSADLRSAVDQDEFGDDHYLGEIVFRIDFRRQRGPAYPWLFIDPDVFEKAAHDAGFTFDILAKADRGMYLAQLTLA